MAGYLGNKSAPLVTVADRKKTFTATAGQTDFDPPGGYTPNQVSVFQNGIRLVDGTDFTATDGTTVSLTEGANVDDQIVIISNTSYQNVDSYTKTQADGNFISQDHPVMKTSTANLSSPSAGSMYYDTTNDAFKMYNGATWGIIKGFNDGSTSAKAARNATELRELGITTSGVYWIDIPYVGTKQVYCDMTIDNGGWMMFGYAGSTSGVGDSNHMVFNTIGTLATTRVNNQTSFSRFDYAAYMDGAGKGVSSMMWKRTSDDNILAHEVGEMWDRFPGNDQAGDRNFGGSSDLNYDMAWMKMSNTGSNTLDRKVGNAGSGIRYENGSSYPGISWNSSYNNNTDAQGGYSSWLNRRALVYWETNGPQSQNQWFHGTVLDMGDGGVSATGSTSRKDVEIYFRVRDPEV